MTTHKSSVEEKKENSFRSVRNRQLDLRRVLFCLITFPLSFYSSMYLYFKWLNYPGPCGENYICFPHVSFLGLGHWRPRCARTPPPLTLSGSPFFIALFSSSICCKMHKYRAVQVHCERKKAHGKMFCQLLEYHILMSYHDNSSYPFKVLLNFLKIRVWRVHGWLCLFWCLPIK